jgi:hypothetical protein
VHNNAPPAVEPKHHGHPTRPGKLPAPPPADKADKTLEPAPAPASKPATDPDGTEILRPDFLKQNK